MTTQIPSPTALARAAAAVDLHPGGRDATVLAIALTRATGADLMLLAVEPDFPLVIPGLRRDRIRRETEAMLSTTRDDLAPDARFRVTMDRSVARGLKRLVRTHHRDLVVVGSSRDGDQGEVSLSSRTRQLVEDLHCALAIAPRGLSQQPELQLTRIGVGYDGGEEALAALAAADRIAAGAGADLVLHGVIDDRIPPLGWQNVWMGAILQAWEEVMGDQEVQLRADMERRAADLGSPATIEVTRGRPATALHALSRDVDLLVIGSRRWGRMARLVLGGTGEALVHGARCSLLLVPRPAGGDILEGQIGERTDRAPAP